MVRPQISIAARLALGSGLLVAVSIVVVSAVFYFGTIGMLDRSIDGKITLISNRLADTYQARPIAELSQEINRELTDGIDSDTEIFLVLSPGGIPVVGNLSTWPDASAPVGQLLTRNVVRDGKASTARMLIRRMTRGEMLYIGRDLGEQESIRRLVLRSLATGAAISFLLIVAGSLLFRRQIEARIARIRRTALEIEAGDLSRRIPISSDDEFGLLNRDINRMLDRIEHLMDGVRHVSNAIAHDLRTPLSRIRSKLEEAVQHDTTKEILADSANTAIEQIDDLILVFEKLLRIAEAESGMRAQFFDKVDLNRAVLDVVELYDATAEAHDIVLSTSFGDSIFAHGDRNLLGTAVANLIDNAIKYTGSGAAIVVATEFDARFSYVIVRDNGPGIPAQELSKVTQRFYRLDQSRNLPGNGLGLAIVSAIATLHGGTLTLENAVHGLVARIALPHIGAAVREIAAARP